VCFVENAVAAGNTRLSWASRARSSVVCPRANGSITITRNSTRLRYRIAIRPLIVSYLVKIRGVSVNIVPADMTNQNLGSSEVTRGERAQRGRANYTSYSKGGPRTHKASNVGSTPFHNVSFLFRSRPGRFTPSARTGAPGYLQIMDNERVRGWRLVLEPGQSASAISQTAPGIRIVVDGGELAESVPGSADRGWTL